MSSMEDRLQRLEDERDIRDVVARFADAVTRNDLTGIEVLWTPDATWTIGEPNAVTCHGIDEIMALTRRLETGKGFFVQFAHSGVIELDGDRATARWILHEVAKGPGEVYYNNYGLFDDEMAKVEGTWHFTRRVYTYLYLDTAPFPGTAYLLPHRSAASGDTGHVA